MNHEADPPGWARVELLVSPTGEMHAIGGDREPGEGDTPYIGLERIADRMPDKTGSKTGSKKGWLWRQAAMGLDVIICLWFRIRGGPDRNPTRLQEWCRKQ